VITNTQNPAAPVRNGDQISLDIAEYTAGFEKAGNNGSVNFNLEYVPFSLDDEDAWKNVAEKLEGGLPVWIIRNGLNNLPQDDKTDFDNFGKTGHGDKNGNGAAAFAVTLKTPAQGSALKITDGVFETPGYTSPYAYIGFKTSGYTGTADVYYAVVPGGSSAPPLSAYAALAGSFAPATHTDKKITITGNNDDVYVMLYKDGDISNPAVINTGTGWAWGAAVTDIAGGPYTTRGRIPLTLTAAVVPSNAAARNIVWTVTDQGGTGATVSGSTLNTPSAAAAGTVKVTASIRHALPGDGTYVKEFSVSVTAPFYKVTGITSVPTTVKAGTSLKLTGTVEPSDTENKTIVWTVKDGGSTGAAITVSGGNYSLKTAGGGPVKVTAAIASGTAPGTDYTQDFTIASTSVTAGGTTLYKKYYVASSGNDNNAGTRTAPLATVQKAFTKIGDDYNADASWPGGAAAGIIVMDTVNVASRASVSNFTRDYPPLLLSDDPESPGGKLQALSSITSISADVRSMLFFDGTKKTISVIMEGGLTLAGTGSTTDSIRGLEMRGGVFIMKGGLITGFNYVHNSSGSGSADKGAGVTISGSFSMTGGEISGNTFKGSTGAGGVYVNVLSGSMYMSGGKISGNTAVQGSTDSWYKGYIGAGGVFVDGIPSGGGFTMTGGEISGNTNADGGGGGVFVLECKFTMSGGEIWGNTAAVPRTNDYLPHMIGGGGAAVLDGKFEKTGGVIYGYNPGSAKSNVVKNGSGAVLSGKGHAVFGVCHLGSTGYYTPVPYKDSDSDSGHKMSLKGYQQGNMVFSGFDN
jgi:hypothetical protein